MVGNKIDWTQTHACNSKLTSLHVFLHKINNFCTCIYIFFCFHYWLPTHRPGRRTDGGHNYVWSRTYYTDVLHLASHTCDRPFNHLSTLLPSFFMAFLITIQSSVFSLLYLTFINSAFLPKRIFARSDDPTPVLRGFRSSRVLRRGDR